MSGISRIVGIAAAIAGAFTLTYLAFAPGDHEPVTSAGALGPGNAGAQTTGQPGTLGDTPAVATISRATAGSGSTTDSSPEIAGNTESDRDLAPLADVDHLARGRRLFWNRDYEAARVELRRAARQRPGTYTPHYLLGLCEQRLGNLETAEREYIAAREIDGDRPEPLVGLARVYLEMEAVREAVEVIEQAVEIDPLRSSTWNVRGRVHLALGHGDTAIAAFAEACRLDSTNAYAWNNLGYARLLAGEHTLAIEPLERAVSLRDDIAYMHNNLGVAREGAGRLAGAFESFTLAAEIDPEHPHAAASAARLEPLVAKLATEETVSEIGTAGEGGEPGETPRTAGAPVAARP